MQPQVPSITYFWTSDRYRTLMKNGLWSLVRSPNTSNQLISTVCHTKRSPAMFKTFWSSGSINSQDELLCRMDSEERAARFRHAARGLEMAMNDDVVQAESIFRVYDDVFHQAGRAFVVFFQAALSFDKEEMRASSDLLEATLTKLDTELSCATADPGSRFPPGSDFNCCIANVLLQLAIVGFLSGHISDAIRAAFRLKRAYNIFQLLHTHMHKTGVNIASLKHISESTECAINSYPGKHPDNQEHTAENTNLSFTDFCVACGTNAGFGILSLVVSLMPPRMARILRIIGFTGNTEDALSTLWDVVNAPNMYGAIALLCMFAYYGGLLALCDITEGTDAALQTLSMILDGARTRYPASAIWMLQTAKLKQQGGNIYGCIDILMVLKVTPEMKQVEALRQYELGISYLLTLQWQKAADQFILVEQMNDWSKSLYHFIIGACYVELYLTTGLKTQAKDAQFHLIKASNIYKRKFMGKELPLEVYVKRKVLKWQSRSPNKLLLDGISFSPILEYFHLFNFWRYMHNDAREQCQKIAARPGAFEDTLDERLPRQLVACAIRRNTKDWTCFDIIGPCSSISKGAYHGLAFPETWAIPYAQYEYAACFWHKQGIAAEAEVRHWLEKAMKFGESEHGQRLAIRLSTALRTLDRAKADVSN